MSKTLTTNDLIARVRLRGMLPEKDVAFSDDNLINLLNEEMDVFGVNQLLKLNEGYLIYSEDQEIDSDETTYVIPYRSIANKLKDIQLVDSSGNVYETSQIDLSQLSDYQAIYDLIKTDVFYTQNNYFCFPNGFPISSGTIRIYFYLRPNKLVKNSKGAKITDINRTTGIVTLETFPTEFSSATLMDFIAAKSPNKIYNYDIQLGTVDSSSKTITFAVEKNVTSVDSSTDQITLTSHGYYTGMSFTISATTSLPTGLSSGTTYYIIKVDANTFKVASSLANANAGTAIDLTSAGSGTITVTPSITHLHEELVVGDYLCIAGETIVPQLPTELHPVLAQRVAALCIDAMEGGPDAMKRRVKEMEVSTTNLLTNRVEDAPKKISQRKGILGGGRFKSPYRP